MNGAMEGLIRVYEISDAVSLVAKVLICILALRSASKAAQPYPYRMLLGAYGCFFLSDAFFKLMWYVGGDNAFVFSSGDLSWVGGLWFLIALDLWRLNEHPAPARTRVAALTAPAIIIGFNAVYIALYPDIYINYLIYAIPTAVLSYTALLLFLADERQSRLRPYHAAVLWVLLVCAMKDLFSTLGWDYGYAPHETVCNALLALSLPTVYLAARRGWRS